jgi:peroxiredoxin
MMRKALLALAALWLTAATVSASEIPFPLTALDPISGAEVALRPGAPATHVVFFAVWCPPCVEELERLSDLELRWDERGYRLIVMAVQTRHSAGRLVRFAKEVQPPGELLFDSEGRVQKALDAGELPLHVVFDANGKIVTRAPRVSDELEAALAGLLEGGAGEQEP